MKRANTYARCLSAVFEELCRNLEVCCTSSPQECSSSCQGININIFPIPRESSFFPAKSPFGATGEEVAVGCSQPLGRREEEPNRQKRAGKQQHIEGLFFVVKQCLHFIQRKACLARGNSYDTWTRNVKTKRGVEVIGHA